MLLYPLSFLFSVLLLLPHMADQFDWQIPLIGILSIPAVGFDYMATFFHELGHATFWWLFGYPSIPTFDSTYGGGMTYNLERMNLMLCAVYAIAASGAFYFFKRQSYMALVILGVCVLLHLAIAFNQGHDVLAIYMGAGAEICIGGFCVLRGVIGHSEYGAAERWVNMIFGLFIIEKNMLMSFGLMTDEISRSAYEQQKGGHGFGDFSRIADMLNVKIESVAAFSMVFALSILALSVVVGLRERRFD